MLTEKDRSSRLERLRAEHPIFVYEDYEWTEDATGTLDCTFRFRAMSGNGSNEGEITFQPTCRISFVGPRERGRVAREVMDNLVFHVGLAELPSYWKAACSPRVEVRTGSLDAGQIAFWTRVLTEGMGEFHYANRTPFTDPDFVTITSAARRSHDVFCGLLEGGHIVPVGGGKDSLVTLDLLGKRAEGVAALAINPPPSTDAAIRIADVAERVVVQRRIDPRLLALNEAGYLNGHTPFGVVIGFVSALAAVLLGRESIVLSNESSSSYSTLLYRGRIINHQFGKSWALEEAMHRYLAEHVATDLRYFSLLRPFNELQIAQRFSEITAFHPVFRSCNRGRKTDSWCGRCSKCLSTFLVLAPFMARGELVHVFGKDLLLDPEHEAVLSSLLSEDGALRPFECVATPAEIRAALELCGGERLAGATLEVLAHRSTDHLVPQDLYRVVDAALRPRVQPLLDRGRSAPLSLDGPTSGPEPPRSARVLVGVLGLGREGTSTCNHLLSTVENLDLTVIDDDPAAAERLPVAKGPSRTVRFASGTQGIESFPDLDILFKSPGVPPDHPAMVSVRRRPSLVTSNTALFFEQRVGTTIGVTGTKGKSTATSLIAHVLSAAGKDARLIGNIGTPCLDGLAGADSRTISCVELSSFQLEDLQASPDIAVVLGVFGDHLDRYRDMASYVESKAAITRYQTRHDVVMYNADCPHATALAGSSPGRRVAFRRERPDLLGDSPGPLLGAFNNYNLWPAVLIGRLFGIEDEEIAAAIRTFRALPGRLEEVADKDGVRFVCDIRSTAPEVTVAALDALRENGEDVGFLFLGGVDRQQDYRTLLPALERGSVRHVLLFPPTGARIRALLESTNLLDRLALFEPESMEEAIRYVYRQAPAARTVCLMSTGAPSNGGLFKGPEDKAGQFAHFASHLGREQ